MNDFFYNIKINNNNNNKMMYLNYLYSRDWSTN